MELQAIKKSIRTPRQEYGCRVRSPRADFSLLLFPFAVLPQRRIVSGRHLPNGAKVPSGIGAGFISQNEEFLPPSAFSDAKLPKFARLFKDCLMEVVRKIVNASKLTPIIDLPWSSNNLQVEVIVFPYVEKAAKQRKISVESLEGCLQAYANSSLWENEKHAWEVSVEGKRLQSFHI